MPNLTAAERERRLTALTEGTRRGLTLRAIAADLGIREDTLRTWRRTNIPTPDYTPRSMPITAPIKRRIRIIPGPSGVTIECHRCRRAFTRPSRRAAERFARTHIRLHPVTDKGL